MTENLILEIQISLDEVKSRLGMSEFKKKKNTIKMKNFQYGKQLEKDCILKVNSNSGNYEIPRWKQAVNASGPYTAVLR